jgi:hypothetical protein
MLEGLNSSVNHVVTIIYLYLWIFAGNFVLLNLFLAVLLDGFSSNCEIEDDEVKDELTIGKKFIAEKTEIIEVLLKIIRICHKIDLAKEIS